MKPIEMDKLTQIVNDATTTNNNCDKCLWGDDECHKIDCWSGKCNDYARWYQLSDRVSSDE